MKAPATNSKAADSESIRVLKFTTGDRAVKKSARRFVIGGLILAVAVLNAYGAGASRMSHFASNSHARNFSEALVPVSF